MSEGFLIFASQTAVILSLLTTGFIYTIVAVMKIFEISFSKLKGLIHTGSDQVKAYNGRLLEQKSGNLMRERKIIGV